MPLLLGPLIKVIPPQGGPEVLDYPRFPLGRSSKPFPRLTPTGFGGNDNL